MKASTLVRQRRCLGSWLAYAFPDDPEDERRPETALPLDRAEGGEATPRTPVQNATRETVDDLA